LRVILLEDQAQTTVVAVVVVLGTTVNQLAAVVQVL
jgi:hypothetical protein